MRFFTTSRLAAILLATSSFHVLASSARPATVAPVGPTPAPRPASLDDGAEPCDPDWIPLFDDALGLMGEGAVVHALASFDDGTGSALFVAGRFAGVGGVAADNIARFDGAVWQPLGDGTDGVIHDLGVHDDGTGPAVYAAGVFSTAGGVPVRNVARWDGEDWSPVGDLDYESVVCLEVADLGNGEELWAGEATTGLNAGVAVWRDGAWTKIGGFSGPSGTHPEVADLAVLGDPGVAALYAVGRFESVGTAGVADTVQAARNVARWDGAAWLPIDGLDYESIASAGVVDLGNGARLWVGEATSGMTAGVASWDGAQWTKTGGFSDATDPFLAALLGFDDGSGTALYAAGRFGSVGTADDPDGGQSAAHLARFDGTSWSSVPSGMDAGVHALGPFDDGFGALLFCGGSFTTSMEGDAHLARRGCRRPATILGCHPHPSSIASPSGMPQIGEPWTVDLLSADPSQPDGLAFLFAGQPGWTDAGCGTFLPGIGEILLALTPEPVALDERTSSGGAATFSVPVPSDPSLAGMQIAAQAVRIGISLAGATVDTSNALLAEIEA